MADPIAFRRWRTSLHNGIAYRRRQSRWWRGVGAWGWWDGHRLRGVVSIGSVTAAEFMDALRRLGEARLRPFDIENVRVEVYRAARSASAFPRSDVAGRYQSMKIAIEPVTVAARSMPVARNMMILPMPIML